MFFFVKINSLPPVREHLTPKFYIDEAISRSVDESSLLAIDPAEKLELAEQDSIILNSILTSPKTIIELPTKAFVDSLHEINRSKHDSSSVFNDQDNKYNNNNITNSDSVTIEILIEITKSQKTNMLMTQWKKVQ